MFDAYELNKSAQYAIVYEIAYLAELYYTLKTPNTVMLGAGPGVLALALMHNYVRYKEELPRLVIVDNKSCDYAQKHLETMVGKNDTVYWIEDSAEAGLKWVEGMTWDKDEVDLLIIDADHSTEAVLRDIDAWFPHVASGGLIFFHDYLEREGGFNGADEWEKGSVAAAIEQRQYLPWQLEAEVGISVVYRKL